ncbi:FAD dependent oxidoreductase [Denitrovibrio acetiphilus DSM 12809]|uniref:FAD dependent oxidoreductase n=1 Tax=Denitrovibrio acetiphilus (strain DSM 12809 / NBRC 114555 / N2460) TaxID=522772 RepID=D4H1E2_DENA2|nr:FAD-dependent oxidoreductase [Denitrovibrio acetiphilus]ADD66890.1 FAD dependent oxidoreductase [Denitrovibrio acetiphilus DSM 12809]
MNTFDFIIIGSGISGMSFAHHMSEQGENVLVLEKKGYAGGCLYSLRHEDFWLELGGHTIYSSYMSFIKTLRELGTEDKFIGREKASFKMYREGKIGSLMSALSKVELALNAPKMFFKKKEGNSVREYYSAILGKSNYDNMFQAMLQAVISQDASGFPADMLLKKRDRDKTAPRNFTLKGGMSTFIDSVAAKENVTLKTDCEAVDVTLADGTYTVETVKGDKFQTPNIVMACPPPVAGKLLEQAAPETASLLSEIHGVKVDTYGVIVRKEDINVEPFSFIIAKDDVFTSAVSRDILPHDKYRGAAFHFCDGALDEDEKISKIEDILGIDRSSIVKSGATVHFSPTLGMDHKDRVRKIDTTLSKYKGLYVVGNYFGGVAIEDCALRAGSAAQSQQP